MTLVAKALAAAATACAVLCVAACSGPVTETLELSGGTMGTHFSVKLPAGDLQSDPEELRRQIEAALTLVNDTLSTYQPNSELSRFNASRSTDWQNASALFCSSVASALLISGQTGGAFDITVGPLVNLWGFGPDMRNATVPSNEQIEALRARTGFKRLETDCAQNRIRKQRADLAIDLSAFGKGLAVDRLADLLNKQSLPNFLLDVGGELRVRGVNAKNERWAIGIEAPVVDQRVPHAIIRVGEAAVATSGDYRNFYEVDGERYSHTIDTRTGRPVAHDLASVTVVAPLGATADALATALLVLGPDDGMALAVEYDIAVLMLRRTDAGIQEQTSPAFDRIREAS